MTDQKQEAPLDVLRQNFLHTKALHLAMLEMGRNSKVVNMSGETKELENRTLGSFVEDGVVIRSEEELLKVEEKLGRQLWYGKNKCLAEDGPMGRITAEQGEEMKAANKKFEAEYPEDCKGYSEYEWGELSGKVSAIRWVLGDEWGNLGT
jgi:hypothetical protein